MALHAYPLLSHLFLRILTCRTDEQLTDKTQVGDLFDRHPDVIGKMAFLLDKETQGKQNWKQLADKFGVPRIESQNFGDSIDDNPTNKLFEYLNVKQPTLTIGEVKSHLKGMQDVLDVITESNKGWFVGSFNNMICELLF